MTRVPPTRTVVRRVERQRNRVCPDGQSHGSAAGEGMTAGPAAIVPCTAPAVRWGLRREKPVFRSQKAERYAALANVAEALHHANSLQDYAGQGLAPKCEPDWEARCGKS